MNLLRTPIDTAIRTAWVSILSSTLLVVLKGVSGVVGNSFALVADAIESATDIVSSILVLLGLRLARKPADENHPYGHGKVEALTTFVVVAFLVASATGIAFQAVENLSRPQDPPEIWTLWVLAGIVAWKELSFRWVVRRSLLTGSTSLMADAWHHRSDAITSVMAFIGIAMAVWLGPGYEVADDWAALFASGLILFNAFRIFRPALGEVMDEQLHPELVEKIREVSLGVAGITATETCHVRKAGTAFQVDLHAVVDGGITVREGHTLAHRLEEAILEQLPQVDQVLVHVEPSH